MAVLERDVFGAPFGVGEYVNLRCLVTAIQTVAPGGTGGAADLCTCVVENPGNPGETAGITVIVPAVQCRKAGASYQG